MKKTNNCWECRYFKITHQPSRPYACDAMGFKSKRLPCLDVVSIDGKGCLSFASKSLNEDSRTTLS